MELVPMSRPSDDDERMAGNATEIVWQDLKQVRTCLQHGALTYLTCQ